MTIDGGRSQGGAGGGALGPSGRGGGGALIRGFRKGWGDPITTYRKMFKMDNVFFL